MEAMPVLTNVFDNRGVATCVWRASGSTVEKQIDLKGLMTERIVLFTQHTNYPQRCEPWTQLFGFRLKKFVVMRCTKDEAAELVDSGLGMDVCGKLSAEQKMFLATGLFPFCTKLPYGKGSVGTWLANAAEVAKSEACYLTCGKLDDAKKSVVVAVVSQGSGVIEIREGSSYKTLQKAVAWVNRFTLCFTPGETFCSELKRMGLLFSLSATVLSLPNSVLCPSMAVSKGMTANKFMEKCDKEEVALSYVVLCALCKTFKPRLSRSWVVHAILKCHAYKHGFADCGHDSFAHVANLLNGQPCQRGGVLLRPAEKTFVHDCHVLDFASFYLSIIHDKNICFSTLAIGGQGGWVPPSVGAHAVGDLKFVQRESGFIGLIPRMVVRLLNMKLGSGFKVFKRVLSSVYGLLGAQNQYLPLFKVGMWAVAEEGRHRIWRACELAGAEGLKCTFMQTDSLFLTGPGAAAMEFPSVHRKNVPVWSAMALKYEFVFKKLWFGHAFYVGVDSEGKVKSSGLFCKNTASDWCRSAVNTIVCIRAEDEGSTAGVELAVSSALEELDRLSSSENCFRLQVTRKHKRPFQTDILVEEVVLSANGEIDKGFYHKCLKEYIVKLSSAFSCLSDISRSINDLR